jgi:hypothetical protein
MTQRHECDSVSTGKKKSFVKIAEHAPQQRNSMTKFYEATFYF